MKTTIATFAFIGCILAQGVWAQTPDSANGREAVVDQRQDNQQKRIDQGVENGSLTKHEAKRLEHEQKKVEKMENKAMADGKMSRKEFRRIEAAQNGASADIRHKKHNRRNK